jgi:ABC-type transport system involved in multi-copper enzyme maturation permease subunit
MTAAMSLIFLAVVFAHTLSLDWRLLVAIAYIYLELLVITALAILFSTFASPILSSIFSLSFYLIGHLSWGLELLIKKARTAAGRTALRVLYLVLPDLENFNFKTEVVHNLPIPSGIFLWSFLYALCYTAFLLALAVLVFRRRDFI